jgi:ribosome-associated heat shock protein Hsp15
MSSSQSESVRLDVWLWATRFFRTRALAKAAVEGGKVDVNGHAGKPSKAVHLGDHLRVTRGNERYEIVVRGLSEQRGPAAVAEQLYEESVESAARRAAEREARRLANAGVSHPTTKPDKKARRQLQANKHKLPPWFPQ